LPRPSPLTFSDGIEILKAISTSKKTKE